MANDLIASHSHKDGEHGDEFFMNHNFDDFGLSKNTHLTNQMFEKFSSSNQSVPVSCPPYNYNPSSFVEQTGSAIFSSSTTTSSYHYDSMFQSMDTSFQRNDGGFNVLEGGNYSLIPRSPSRPLSEKILTALTLFRASCDDGMLAQLWAPIKRGDGFTLSTSEQPCLLDQRFTGYRDVSRLFTFSPTSPFSGLPGRVFSSAIPEWTSNVIYYKRDEYLRLEYAVNHCIRGCIGIPIFEKDSTSCCAVLEIVTLTEKPDFVKEMEIVCQAFQTVSLRSTSPPQFHRKSISNNQRAALDEINSVLKRMCRTHKLPLALTWTPCSYPQGNVLLIEHTACYVNNNEMQSFVLACQEHHLLEGQGVCGKALQLIHPFFCEDVKTYSIYEYPLVHHARKFNLNAAVAITLRSIFTGDKDYIIEFFLPVNMKETTHQQLLLSRLAVTMQSICKNLRTASDGQFFGNYGNFSFVTGTMTSQVSPVQVNQGLLGEISRPEKKQRYSNEKTVSINDIQKHFSGSLKDAAKNMGVCPTTLKRMCRQQGIPRWPSRKLNKMNRTLQKVQTELGSVKGVEGSFKIDPSSGVLVAAGTIPTQEATTSDFGFEMDRVNVEQRLYLSSNNVTGNFDSSNIVYDPKEHNQPIIPGTSSYGYYGSSIVTVKATYKENTIRFKFDPSTASCEQLYEEVGTRFKLQGQKFQLKYLDDEEEWVILSNNSDLQECLGTLNLVGTRTVKFLVSELSTNM